MPHEKGRFQVLGEAILHTKEDYDRTVGHKFSVMTTTVLTSLMNEQSLDQASCRKTREARRIQSFPTKMHES